MTSTGPPSVVVTDLDGTLWHTDDQIAAEVVDAVAEVERRGVPLLVATGRRLASTVAPLARVGVRLPMVVLNGALGVEVDGVSRFHTSPYEPDEAAAVLAACRSVGLDPVVQVDHPDVEVFMSTTPGTHPDHVDALRPFARFDDLDRVVAEESVLGFSLLGIDNAAGARIERAIGTTAESHLDRSIEYVGGASLTVAPKGQSKWDGVSAFCETHGLDASRVLCLADGANDIELLDNSAVRLVPAVAHPDAAGAGRPRDPRGLRWRLGRGARPPRLSSASRNPISNRCWRTDSETGFGGGECGQRSNAS